MKKILFLLAMLPMMCYGQDSLKVNDIISDGARIISVSPVNPINFRQYAFSAEGYSGMQMMVYPNVTKTIHDYGKKNQRAVYNIGLNSISYKPIHIAEGAKLLIKKGDDTVMTLKSYVEMEDRIGDIFGSSLKYHIPTFFILTLNNLEELANGNVSKLRIEYTIEPKDFILKNNRFSEFIKEALIRIQNAETIKDKFLDGF